MRQVQGLSMPTRFSSSLLALFLFVSVAAEAAPGSPAECADRCCAQSALGEVCAADCQLQCEKTGLTDPIAVALGDAPAPAGDPPALKPGMLQPGWQPIAEQAMGDIRTGVMQAHPDASRATALGDDNGTVRTAIYAFVMAAGSAKPAADTAQGAEDSLVDAFWQSSIGPQTSEANGTERITRAYTFANAITQLSHSVYGGPPGAAAYAAWWAYQQPDTSPAQALRIGLLVGAGLWASERHGDGQPVAVAEVQRSSLAAMSRCCAGCSSIPGRRCWCRTVRSCIACRPHASASSRRVRRLAMKAGGSWAGRWSNCQRGRLTVVRRFLTLGMRRRRPCRTATARCGSPRGGR
jgi:hypothetical protein